MPQVFTSIDTIINEMLGDISYSPDSRPGSLYPFFVRVGVCFRRPPRHPYFEYLRDMGQEDINRMFSGKALKKSELTFIFPERWLGVVEQQAFMVVVLKAHERNPITKVDIITASPMLVGDFMKEQIRILKWEDDSNFEGNSG